MPHGESWFSLLSSHERFQHFAAIFSKPLNEEGHTWIGGVHVGVQHLYGALFVLVLLAMVAVLTETSIYSAGKDIVPEKRASVRTMVELFVGAIYGMMGDIMGKKAARYFLPLIGTCAFFILFSNFLGMVPGFQPPTSNLNTTLGCGLIIFIATHVYGLRENGFNHVKHLFGPKIGLPWLPLMLLMFVIESISHVVRPISLGVRLMANMTADHMVVGMFLGFAAVLLFPFLVWLPFPFYLLGTLVVIVQTLVFCLLSTIYIAMAIEHAEH